MIAHIDQHIKDCEAEMDDDAESIITNQRYAYINGVVDKEMCIRDRCVCIWQSLVSWWAVR